MTVLRADHRIIFNLPNSKPRVGVNVPVPAVREAAIRADPPDTTAKFT